jgi:hypothetical protein
MRGPWEGRPELRGRCVLFVGDDVFLVFSWGPGPFAARYSAEEHAFLEAPIAALPGDIRAALSDGAQVCALDATGDWHSLSRDAEGKWVAREETPNGTHLVRAESARVTRDGFEWLAAAPVEALAVDEQGRLAVCRRDGVVELRDAKNGGAARDPRTRRPLQPRHVLRRGPSALHRGLGRPVAREPSLILR